MLERSARTAIPVLGGDAAGVTCTVRSVVRIDIGSIPDGEAVPRPESCVGSPPHPFTGAPLLRGIGAIRTKSFTLLSVSTQPLAIRTAAVGLLRSAVAAVSKQFAVPYPTKSTILPLAGQAP